MLKVHLPESVTENIIFAQDGDHLEGNSDQCLHCRLVGQVCISSSCLTPSEMVFSNFHFFKFVNQSCSHLVVLDDLKRSGDNKAEAVNALPSVVEQIPRGATQQSLNQIQYIKYKKYKIYVSNINISNIKYIKYKNIYQI